MDVTNQISALNYVYNTFEEEERRCLKRKFADLTIEMERARMSSQDTRALERVQDAHSRTINEVKMPALHLIADARACIGVALESPRIGYVPPSVLVPLRVMVEAQDALEAAETILRDRPETDSEVES